MMVPLHKQALQKQATMEVEASTSTSMQHLQAPQSHKDHFENVTSPSASAAVSPLH